MATVTGLDDGTTYTFTVTASNGGGTSPPSEPSNAITTPDVPGVPNGVVAEAGIRSASVRWARPDTDGGNAITGYMVTLAPPVPTAVITMTGTTASVTGLANGTSYGFAVAATNDVGSGAASASPAVTTPDVPGAPSGLVAVGGNAAATLAWTAPASTGGMPLTGYWVVASPPTPSAAFDVSGTAATITGLVNGTKYTFQVYARNAAGDGVPSAASNAVVPMTAPGAPTGLVAERGNASATLHWMAPASDGGGAITRYEVMISPPAEGASTAITGTSAVVAGLVNGTSYTFRVFATNAAGDGPPSGASAAVTPMAAPGAPRGVVAEAGIRSASVRWTAPENDGGGPIAGYTVTVAPAVPASVVTVAGTTATVTGLANGASYTFAVTARNEIGAGAASAPSTAITTPDVPGAPTGLLARATPHEAAATLSWGAPGSDGGRPLTGYTVSVVPAAPSAVISVSGTTANVSGLTFGTTYAFQVAAINAAGTGPASAPSNAVTPFANRPPRLVVSGQGALAVGKYAFADATETYDPDGDPVTFAWSLTSVPAGSEALVYDAATARPAFLADRRGVFELTLVASDGMESSWESIWISAGDVVVLPEAPVITVAPGTTVRFDAQCSFGRWFTNGGYGPFGDPPGTEWPFPDHADFTFYDVGVFTAWGECDPFFDEPYASFSRTVVVRDPSTAVAISPARPVREIGGAPLEFTAAVGGVPAAVDWSLSEATGALSAGSGEAVTYVPPDQGSPPRLVTLTATSANGDSASVEILLTATPPPRTNHPPVARIASFGTALVGTAVLLDARASFDPDGDPLRWTWELTGVPQGSAAFIADPSAEVTTFVPDVSGSYQVTLTVDDGYGGTATVTVVVTGSEPPAAIVALSTLAQVTGAGKAVADPPSVRVTDRNGYPVAGVEVLFQVTAGGGSVTGSPAYTSASGAATAVEWTVGGDGAQEVVAQVAGQPELSVAFTATARAPYAGYDVSLQFLTSASDPVVRAFNRARARIEEIITGDLPDVYFGTGLNACGYLLSGATDDLFIGVEVANIDGAGGILGQAGPCLIRTSSSLPAFGIMRFDAADLAVMEADGTLDSVILHEMLHVVGIGTIWESLGLLQGAGGADPVFLGAGATEAFLAFNGGPTYAGAPVPVENTGGSGTQDSHWRESVFGRELMTGWIGGATNPLSRTTIGSLADLGYSVQLDAAEPFDISAALRLPGPAPVRMDEVILKPTHGIDDAGRLTPLAQ